MNSNPIDLTTVAAVKSWIGITTTSDDDNIQRCITSASLAWLRRCGRGPISGSVPTESPFNQVVSYQEVYDGPGGNRLFLRNWPIQSVSSLTVDGLAQQASSGPTVQGYVIDASRKSISSRGATGFLPGYGVGFGALGGQGGRRPAAFPEVLQSVAISYMAGFPVVSIEDELRGIPATPGPYTITTQERWLADLGVQFFIGGTPLTKVLVSPAAGEYYLQGPGVYLFAAADQAKQVQISYQAPGTPWDVEERARMMVALNYKRRQWIDQSSQAMANGAGTTSFRDWELSPDILATMELYRRVALV